MIHSNKKENILGTFLVVQCRTPGFHSQSENQITRYN